MTRWPNRPSPLLLALPWLALAGPAFASSVVLHDGADAAAAAVAGKEALGTGDFTITRLDDVPGLPASGLVAIGGAVEACGSAGGLAERAHRPRDGPDRRTRL